MTQFLEKACRFSSTDTYGPVDAIYGDYSNVGFIVDSKTHRIKFYPKINKVTIIDSGNIEIIRRRFPIIGKPIEVGIPTPSLHPLEDTRIEFKDIRGRKVTISGLKITT